MSIVSSKDCHENEDGINVGAPTAVASTFEENDNVLEECIRSCLPSNYNFEIRKTLRRLVDENVQHVALQFPEGLLNFSTQISLILRRFLPRIQVTIMGDVSYGACCIDDFTASAIGCDFIVHYGHSCLVSVDVTLLRVLYVFVDILFDPRHLCETLKTNFIESDRLILMSTIQYASTIHRLKELLQKEAFFNTEPFIPQVSPLTAGEVLGCTSPVLVGQNGNGNKCSEIFKTNQKFLTSESAFPPSSSSSSISSFENVEKSNQSDIKNESVLIENKCDVDYVIFVADGRFHLESAMIQNPQLSFYRYDPFSKVLLRESYDHDMLHSHRQRAIDIARHANTVCLIMGTLGRQGNTKIVENIQNLITQAGKKCFTLLLSEIIPETLNKINTDAFVQVACPRLSIDWGHCFNKPLLSPYESHVAFGGFAYLDIYPMDYYSVRGGAWTNYYNGNQVSRTAAMKEDRRSLLRKRIANKKKNRLAKAVYESDC